MLANWSARRKEKFPEEIVVYHFVGCTSDSSGKIPVPLRFKCPSSLNHPTVISCLLDYSLCYSFFFAPMMRRFFEGGAILPHERFRSPHETIGRP